jgi:tRNA (cytidine/uridine-2'-O-)-methyltransferase
VPFHVVLHQPEIPNNTGNIGRTCVATGASLGLIHPLGFDTSEKACRRAGLDYWPRLKLREYGDWGEYERAAGSARRWVFSTKGGRCAFDVPFEPGDHLIFGSETRGLPDSILAGHAGRSLFLPMVPDERSLNLATVVCTIVYEGVRQLLRAGTLSLDARGRFAPHDVAT